MTNQLPTPKGNGQFAALLQPSGLENLQLLVTCNTNHPCNRLLFLRTILAFSIVGHISRSCPVIQAYSLQEYGTILFSTTWKDHNTFGHFGAPLMGMCVKVCVRLESEA